MIENFKRYFVVYIFIIFSILSISCVFLFIKQIEYNSSIKTFNAETQRRKNAIQEHLVKNLNTLKLIQSYINNDKTINRREFSKFVTPVIESDQNIQAIEWIPVVWNQERSEYEEKARKEGLIDFNFKEYDINGNIIKANSRDYYYPVYYLEPIKSNEKVLGFDISKYSFAKNNLNRVVERFGFAVASGLKLIQDTTEYGLVVYMPVYIEKLKDGLYNSNLYGFVTGVYKASSLIKHVMCEFDDAYPIQVIDITDRLHSKTLYSSYPQGYILNTINQNSYLGSSFKIFKSSYSIKIANVKWEIVFNSYLKEESWRFSSVFLLIGCISIILVAYVLFLNKKSNIGIGQLNRLLTEELKKKNEYEEELNESEEKFSKLFLYSPIPISLISFKNRILVDINLAFESQFGLKKVEVIGKTTLNTGLWVNTGEWEDYYKVFFEKGEVLNYEMQAKTALNEINTYLVTGKRINYSEEEYILNFFQNITERKKFEIVLQNSEQKYREIFSSVNDSILIYDVEYRVFVDANKKALDFFDYSIQELKNIDFKNLIPNKYPYTYEALSKVYFENVGSKKSGNTEWQVKDRNERIYDVDISFKETLVKGRSIVIIVIRDISERKRIERLLIENEFLFRSQFDNSNIGIVISSPGKEFIRANKRFCTMIGFSEEELVGKTWSDYTFTEDYDNEVPLHDSLMKGEQDGYELNKRFLRKDGGIVYTHISISCFRNPDQSIHYIIAYVFEITDRVEIENKLIKTIIETEERERSRFAQELHDGLGPLLSSIKMYAQWMLKPGANINQVDVLEQIENLANLSNQSVKEIAFGLSPHILKDFGIIEALQSFISKVNATSGIKFEIINNLSHRFDETTETVIYRILTECISNSLKHSKADQINIAIMESEKYLDIEFSDNGVGFDLNEVADNKFGMGLHNIKNRLKSINGKLLIFSQKDKGTTFKINILL